MISTMQCFILKFYSTYTSGSAGTLRLREFVNDHDLSSRTKAGTSSEHAIYGHVWAERARSIEHHAPLGQGQQRAFQQGGFIWSYAGCEEGPL